MLSRANDKLSMENLIIAAGNFNSEKSTADTRRSALIHFLKQVQLEQEEVCCSNGSPLVRGLLLRFRRKSLISVTNSRITC